MSAFVYPASDLDRARNIVAVLGSFWARTYTRRDQITSYAEGTAMLVAQSYRNLLETVAALSRVQVPLYHTEMWTPITIRKSQRNAVATNIARFDNTTEPLDGKLVFDTAANLPFYAFPRPDKLVHAPQILNKLLYPTVSWAENSDYTVDLERDALVFVNDPFENPNLLRKGIYSGNELVDEEITLWAFMGQFDYDLVFNQFAYALGMRLKTSQGYKDLMNAVMSGLVNGGATVADLDMALAAICDVPLVVEDDETVEVVKLDRHGLLIVTDKRVYRFDETANPLVAVGDKLRAGDRLVDALQIVELTNGVIPADITALALDRGFLSACFYGDLVFENKQVPLEIDTAHESGYTYLKFGLGGFPADVQRFFDDLHARGIEASLQPAALCDPPTTRFTLAQFLDRRQQPSGEPTAAHLPATINPLQFVVQNILRNNVFFVQIKSGALGRNRLGLYNIRHLRQLLPPHAAMIVIYDLQGANDSLSGPDNITEGASTFTGMEPREDAVAAEMVVESAVTLRTMSGTCQ